MVGSYPRVSPWANFHPSLRDGARGTERYSYPERYAKKVRRFVVNARAEASN